MKKLPEGNWYALYTKSRAEKKVLQAINELGIEAYLPLKTEWKQWSDRKKQVETPLIASYIFVRVDQREYYQVLNIPGAIRYIFFEGKAAAIPDWQIKSLQQTLASRLEFTVVATPFRKGDRIAITEGPLCGFKGEVIDPSKPKELLVRIEHIGYSLLVKVASAAVASAPLA